MHHTLTQLSKSKAAFRLVALVPVTCFGAYFKHDASK
jgi:hypothetical protein